MIDALIAHILHHFASHTAKLIPQIQWVGFEGPHRENLT
jgi:hypothetical protein